MHYIEKSGAIVLLLVLLAFLNLIPQLTIPTKLTIDIYVLIGCIALLAIVSIARNLLNKNSYKILYLLSLLLLVIGAYMFFLNTIYFYGIKNLGMPYWYLVSMYSLPAICVEGGLLTLYTAFSETHELNIRERKILLSGLLIYLTYAISANFLVIGDILPIKYHLLAYNSTLIAVCVSSVIVYISKAYKRK